MIWKELNFGQLPPREKLAKKNRVNVIADRKRGSVESLNGQGHQNRAYPTSSGLVMKEPEDRKAHCDDERKRRRNEPLTPGTDPYLALFQLD